MFAGHTAIKDTTRIFRCEDIEPSVEIVIDSRPGKPKEILFRNTSAKDDLYVGNNLLCPKGHYMKTLTDPETTWGLMVPCRHRKIYGRAYLCTVTKEGVTLRAGRGYEELPMTMSVYKSESYRTIPGKLPCLLPCCAEPVIPFSVELDFDHPD